MTSSIERHSHLTVTRQTEDGAIVHTDVHVTSSITTTMSAAVLSAHPDPALQPGVQPDALAGAALRAVNDGNEGVCGSEDVDDIAADVTGTCFDPDTCCDARERALIMAMRAYLRPDVAPECLMKRLRATLDHCCCEPDSDTGAGVGVGAGAGADK